VFTLWLLLAAPLPNTFAKDAIAKAERIALWDGPAPVGGGATETANAFITVYHPKQTNGTAVVICPGGGYACLVKGPEGHGIAYWLNQNQIIGVVLEYRLPRGKPFVPLLDAQQAIRFVRSKAREWDCDPERIGVMGFSAGGHLASTASTHFDNGDPESSDPVNKISCRPDFAILIYPVITMGQKTHFVSKHNLLGQNPKLETVEFFSNEKQVTSQTPPTFLVHAKDDQVVSPENSRLFFRALQDRHVTAKYLELPIGNHGFNGKKGPIWEMWKTQCLKWLVESGIVP